MSRPWSKRVRVTLGTRCVAATLLGAWPRRTHLASARCTPEPAGVGAPGDLDPLLRLDQVLREIGLTESLQGAVLDVTIDDALVHLDVATGDFAGSGSTALQAVAEACLGEMLGAAAADHALRWQLQPDERHLLICAIHRGTLSALAAVARSHGLQSGRINAAFSRAWDAHAMRAMTPNLVVAVGSDEHTVLCCVVEHSICALSRGPALDGPSAGGAVAAEQPAGAASDLDRRTDRLLAACGLDASAMGEFLLVLAGDPPMHLAPRWSVARVGEPATTTRTTRLPAVVPGVALQDEAWLAP